MNPDLPELSTLSAQLDELQRRVTAVADRYHGTEREHVAVDLFEVERSLRSAGRRLARVVRTLDTP